jgi:hypothetical protein
MAGQRFEVRLGGNDNRQVLEGLTEFPISPPHKKIPGGSEISYRDNREWSQIWLAMRGNGILEEEN